MTTTPNARNRSPRARLALALEPRILLDAAAVATAVEVAAKADASATAPGAEATPTKSTVTIKDSTDSFAPVNLFDNVKVTLDGSGQVPTELTLQVSSSGSNQALVIDGEQIVLQNGSGSTSANLYSWTVSVENGVSTVTINILASTQRPTAERAQTLIDNLRYQVLDKSVESGTVSITLKSLSDEGGQSTDLSAIKASVTLDNQVNRAPVLSDSGGLDSRETYTPADLGIGAGSEVAWSADGRFAYVAGGSSVQVFSVDANGALTRLQTYSNSSLGTISDLVISADGTSIYTHSGGTSVTLLSVGEDGKISSTAAYSAQNGSITGSLAISEDGQYVYAGTSNNDVVVFTRDTDTGALAVFTRALTTGNNRGGVIVTQGDLVFVLYEGGKSGEAPTLAVYQHDAQGKLPQQLTNVTLTGLGTNSTSDSLVISADGKSLYISDPSTGLITIVRFDGSALTRLGTVSLSGVSSLAISQDGSLLYATASNGTLNVYQVEANGNLTLSSSQAGNTTGKDIAVSSNGSLLVAGDNVTRYTSVQALNLGQATSFADGLTFKDANFDVLDNYNGASITVDPSVSGGSFGLSGENGLTLNGNAIERNGVAIGTFTVGNDGTLTVTFTADTSKAVANQVLQQLTYSAANGTTTGSLVTLQVTVSDGLLASGVLSLALRANSAPVANGGSYTPPKATSETDYSVELPANLFSDADGEELAWTVDGLPDGLVFDTATRTVSGTTLEVGNHTLTLTAIDAAGNRATLVLELEVAQIDNRAPQVNPTAATSLPAATVNDSGYSVTLPDNLFSDADSVYTGSTLTWSVSTLPAGLTFDAQTHTVSGTPTTVGDSSVTITVTDEHGVTAEHVMILRVVSQAEASNNAPTLSAGTDQLTYTSDGALSGFNQFVNSIKLSDDGRTLIVSASTSNNANGTHTLYVYSRDTATGELTLRQSFRQGTVDDGNAANGIEIDGLQGVTSVTYSADGSQLFLAGFTSTGSASAYTLSVFAVNSSDGSLTLTGQVPGISERILELRSSANGNALYALSATSVYVYSIDGSGNLGALEVERPASLGTAVAMSVDGQGTLYVIASGRLTLYTSNADGSLNYAGQLTRSASNLIYTNDTGVASTAGVVTNTNAFNGANALTVSADGTVYLTTSNGFLTTLHYNSTSNTLALINHQDAYTPLNQYPHTVVLSSDGTTLYIGGGSSSKLAIYHIQDNSAPLLSGTLDISGGISRIAVSADGTSLYAGRNVFFGTPTLSQISASDSIAVSYAEGSSINPASGLSVADADYDALGNYNGASITLVRENGASADDSFDIAAGSGLSVDNGQILLGSTPIASYSTSGNQLTITFTGDVSKATVNQVLQQITYRNTSADPQATIRLTLSVQDQFASGVDSQTLALTVAQRNDAPQVVSTSGGSLTHNLGDAPTALFDDTAISAVEAGQTITALTFSVSGVKDGASETLTLDGTQIALVAGSGVTASGLTYTVTLSNGTATVLLSSASGVTGSAAAAIVDGARYTHSDNQGATLGVRSITLSAVKDSGGTANAGSDTTTPTLTAEVNVTRESPVLGANTGGLELVEQIVSYDWPDPYAGIDSVVSVGEQVYVLRSTTQSVYNEATDSYAEATFSTLYVFTRNADGTLTLRDTVEASASNGLGGASSHLALSADGNSVYLTTQDNGIAVFSRDSESGALTAQGTFAGTVEGLDRVLIQGNTAYLSNGTSLSVFTRTGSTWSLGATLTPGDGNAVFTQLQLSADGKFLYVGNSGGNTLVSVYTVADNGALTPLEHLAGSAGSHYTDAMVLSADGKTLYVTDDKTVYSLKIGSDGKLTRNADAQTLTSKPTQLLASTDGGALIVVTGDTLALYSLNADGSVGASRTLDVPLPRFPEFAGASLSDDGKQLYLIGNFNENGMMVLNLTAQPVTYVEGGDAAAVLPGGTLHDPQLDALNGGLGNYNGASIVIARDGGGNAEDVFSLLEGNGLTLDNGQVMLNGQAIATFVQSNGTLTLTFIASVSQANAQQVLRSIAYSNTSQDPASSATLRMVLNDGDSHSDSRLVELTLEGVNDAPVVSTTGLTPTFNAEGEPVKLFNDTLIDVIESDQQVWQLVLTLEPASDNDIISVEGGKIYLSDKVSGARVSASGQEYLFIRNGSTVQLVIYVMGDAQRAQAMADTLTYSNSGDNLSGTRTITLSVRDSGGGSTNLGTASSQAEVTLAGAVSPNTAPELSGSSAGVGYTEQGAPVYLAPDASISDTQMDAYNNGQGNYDGAVISVALGDGHTSSDQLAFKAGNGLSLDKDNLIKDGKVIGTLSVSDGVLTLRFSDAAGQAPTTADVNNALHQITYANSSDAPVASVAVTITLTDQRGLAAETLALSVNIAAINDAPVIGKDLLLSIDDLQRVQDLDLSDYGLATPTGSAVSADGSHVYIADGQGHIALFNRDDSGALTHVSTLSVGQGIGQMQVSADGKNLYALSSDGNAILCFSSDAQGSLALLATVVSQSAVDGDGLKDLAGISLSTDGKTLFVTNRYTVLYLNRDTDSGALTYTGSLETNMWFPPYMWTPTEIVSRGDLLFVVTDTGNGSSLLVYQQADDGSLAQLTFSREGNGALSGLQQLTVSADGKTVYVATDSQVIRYSFDSTSATLTYQGTLQGGGTITDITLSADGALLFVSLQDGTVNRYATVNDSLTGSQQVGSAGQLLLTDNGVLVLGSDATIIASELKDGPQLDADDRTPVLLDPSLTLSDAELDHADNYQGASLTISGQAGDSIGVLAGGSYTLDGSNVMQGSSVVATLTRDGNVTTLTFTAALTRDQANALVRQLTWTSSADAPAQASSHALTLVLNDGSGSDAKASNSLSIDVTLLPPNQPPVLNDAYADYALSGASAGTRYSVQLPADLFSDPEGEALTYSISGLPTGLSFDPATRTLSGTAPREVGTLSLTLTVTDASGKATTLVLELDVANSVPVADGGYHLPGVTIGQPYEVQLPDSLFRDANDDNLTWQVVGELPEWLQFDADSHTLTGTAPATPGSYSITLRADDGQGGTTEVTLTLAVALPASSDGVAPVIDAAGAPAVTLAASNTPFEVEEPASAALQTGSEPSFQPAPASVSRSTLDDGGLASSRSTLAAQLANADRIVTDTGFQGDADAPVQFDGKTLRADIDLGSHDGRWISLRLPLDVAEGASVQRVTLANGLPLPSWAAFDARSGEIRIDSRYLQRHGEVRLNLVLRDADGREQRLPLHIRAQGQEPARADNAEAPATLSQQLGRQASGSLYTEAMDLLEQLGEWANDDFQHIA